MDGCSEGSLLLGCSGTSPGACVAMGKRFTVSLDLDLPVSAGQFDTARTTLGFFTALANTSHCGPCSLQTMDEAVCGSCVLILHVVSSSSSVRRSAPSIKVNVQILLQSLQEANQAQNSIQATALNAQLAMQGLPPATIVNSPAIQY